MSENIIRNENNVHLSDEDILALIDLREKTPAPDSIQKTIDALDRSNGQCEFKFQSECSQSLLKNFIVNDPIDENIITLCCENCFNWAFENKEQVFLMGYMLINSAFEIG